ncbi:MAG: universal stress protein [Propionibacteriales bacterium]|nr:universal stress protein [Propionibacteriales bacterium]
MHILIATDGSRQSLTAARHLKTFVDPEKVNELSILAVIRPLAAVAFADELSVTARRDVDREALTFREAATSAVATIAAEFDGWGPKVHQRIRSGSPANEIIKCAKQLEAGLIVVASGGRGNVLVGGTAQRVQNYAPCPVLVVRPAPRQKPVRRAKEAGDKKESVKPSRRATKTAANRSATKRSKNEN